MEAASATGPTVSLDATAVIKPAFHHVNLKTTRLQEMIDWYCTVVGMTPNFQSPMGAFLTNDAANHRIALTCLPAFGPDPDKLTHDGMHHTAFEYGSLDELLGSYLRLKTDGIVPHACVDHGLTTSFYYLDPDENSVELQADNYGDWTKSTEFIRTDRRFVEDPIGKLLDPDALVAARQTGAEPWDIHERAYAGEFPPSTPPDLRLPLPPPPHA
jgi:catechol-2,3-dioxygenase